MTRASSEDDIIIITIIKLSNEWVLKWGGVSGLKRRWAEATTLTVKPVWQFTFSPGQSIFQPAFFHFVSCVQYLSVSIRDERFYFCSAGKTKKIASGTAPSQRRIVTEVEPDAAKALYIWAFLLQEGSGEPARESSLQWVIYLCLRVRESIFQILVG